MISGIGATAGLCRSTETVTSVEMVGIQARFLTLSGIDFLIPYSAAKCIIGVVQTFS